MLHWITHVRLLWPRVAFMWWWFRHEMASPFGPFRPPGCPGQYTLSQAALPAGKERKSANRDTSTLRNLLYFIFPFLSRDSVSVLKTVYGVKPSFMNDTPKNRFRGSVSVWLIRNKVMNPNRPTRNFIAFLWLLYMKTTCQLSIKFLLLCFSTINTLSSLQSIYSQLVISIPRLSMYLL